MNLLWLAVAFVLASASPSLAADGDALWSTSCASCHGDDGTGDTAVGRAMKIPSLAAKPPTTDQVTKAVREHPSHGSASSKLSDEDLAAIAGFLSSLSG